MSALLLAVLLLGQPPASASPSPSPSPAPPASEASRDKSLGAVAKRAPAPKKAAPAKVLTNEDLEKARQGGAAVSVLAADGVEPAPTSAGSESGEGRRSSEESGPTDSVPRDEATWRSRAEAARTRIKDAEAIVSSAEQRLAELRSDVAPEDPMNPFRQQTRDAEIKVETERLEAARADVAAARQAMSDLEEEARRASIPPGWLREP